MVIIGFDQSLNKKIILGIVVGCCGNSKYRKDTWTYNLSMCNQCVVFHCFCFILFRSPVRVTLSKLEILTNNNIYIYMWFDQSSDNLGIVDYLANLTQEQWFAYRESSQKWWPFLMWKYWIAQKCFTLTFEALKGELGMIPKFRIELL